MGQDKALIEFEGNTMLQRAIELLRPHAKEILVIGDPARYAPAHATVIPDNTPDRGPLGGLVTALHHARYVRLLILACDLPNINDRLLIRLKQALTGEVDAVIPRHAGFLEPLAGAYHKHAMEPFQACLDQGFLKMAEALARVHTHHMDVTPGEGGWPAGIFKNLNSPADL